MVELRNYKFHDDSKKIIYESKDIIDNNDAVTLRMIFYKLVGKSILKNDRNNYQKLSRFLTKARYSGLIPFDAIVDRSRTNIMPNFFDDVEHLIRSALASYDIDVWDDQSCYVEILVEKDTLVGVLEGIARKYKIPLCVNRGYTSLSELYDLSQRIKEKNDDGKVCFLLYIGDLDPSGLDMSRDIQSRLNEFDVDFVFNRLLLNISDVHEHKLLPNMIKKGDPRSKTYPYDNCWEVDALDPNILKVKLVSEIEKLIDMKKWNESMKLKAENIKNIEKRFGV